MSTILVAARRPRNTTQRASEAGAGCLYINKLADVDETVLAELIRLGYRYCSTVLHQA